MGPIRCPETSVNNYHTMPCNYPEDRRFQCDIFYSESWPVRMGPIRCPETSVNNYHTTPCNNPEDRRFQCDISYNNIFLLRGVNSSPNIQNRGPLLVSCPRIRRYPNVTVIPLVTWPADWPPETLNWTQTPTSDVDIRFTRCTPKDRTKGHFCMYQSHKRR
jgi:hypothetical protein